MRLTTMKSVPDAKQKNEGRSVGLFFFPWAKKRQIQKYSKLTVFLDNYSQ